MLNEDYKDMLLSLQSEGVNFILVGAYALAAHGFPRAALDIDIWIEPAVVNAQKVYKALTKFGAPLKDISKEDLISKDLADIVLNIAIALLRGRYVFWQLRAFAIW